MALEEVFDHFRKNHITILLGYFNVNYGREDILQPITRNESLLEASIDNGARVVTFAI
jgi:hypothetical protein